MTRARIVTIALGLLVGPLGSGCPDEDESGDEAAEQGAAESAEEGTDEPGAAEPTAEEVPIPEDYADEAESEITEDNYEQELDELAEEIEGPDEGGQ